jgi:peptide deformylase
MIYPVIAYGDPVLKKKAVEVIPKDLDVPKLIEDMYETMYLANGVGLAAPQIGKSLRMFVIDASPMDDASLKEVFINPEILSEEGEDWPYEEGCLSIPGIRADVTRKSKIRVKYLNADLKEKEVELVGLEARVVQHEFDHIEGKLFTDYMSSLKRRLFKKKLQGISKGIVDVSYKMKFPIRR